MRECVRRAKRDRADVLALHSSPIMTATLAMLPQDGICDHFGFNALQLRQPKMLPQLPTGTNIIEGDGYECDWARSLGLGTK
jgi:hypothetical protein